MEDSSDTSSEVHIGTAEMAKLLEESRGRPETSVDGAGLHPHLATCLSCRSQFEGLSSLDRQLKTLSPVETAPSPDRCPVAEVWREIAAGLTPSEQTLTYLEHASHCGHCGPLLRTAIADLTALNGAITEMEQKHIATLESAREDWQRTLAQRIISTAHIERNQEAGARWRRWFAVPRLAIATACLSALIAVGTWILVQRNQPATASHLIARAYTEKRTLELRLAGAGYAPIRVSRGAATSFTSRPPDLLKAEAEIAIQLQAHPSDPAWLQAKAQADVLEGKYDAAIEALRHALQLEPASPPILTDLATAYFQLALETDRKEDFGAAFEYLSQALKIRPDDPVALFNRAIVAEHQFLYQQAIEDWQHYLRLDPSSQWAQEAESRLDALREKLKQHGRKMLPLLGPAQVAAATGATAASDIDQRIEEYLHEAVSSWLPEAFPETRPHEAKGVSKASASEALFFLAELTRRRHSDQWLTDLLRGSSSPHFPQAANTLALAVQANATGDFSMALERAHLAEKLFRDSNNEAGVLRARFEQTIAQQIERHSEDCRRNAKAALAESERRPYPWLQIQLRLEEGVCSLLMGDVGTYGEAAKRAQGRAQQVGYGTLYLRALGFVADSKLSSGDRAGVWKLVNAGLDRYWSGSFPAMRAYSLYTFEAEATTPEQTRLHLAVWREATDVVDSDGNLLIRAAARSSLARAANEAREPDLAEREYAEAARLYALEPQSDAVRAERIESEILTAKLEARRGATEASLARLARAQNEILPASDDFLAEIFYSALGEAHLSSHQPAEAEQAFHVALRLAERNLASLTTEASRATWSRDVAPVYLGLVEAELLQGREQESLDVFDWYLAAPQRAGPRNITQHSSEPMQSLPAQSLLPTRLPVFSDRTVLAYGILPDGLAIWVYDNRGVHTKWIPKSPEELQTLVSNFYAECSDPSSEISALRRDGQALYALLIAPVEQWLEQPPVAKRTLAIETGGLLARLPFEALMDPNGRYLIERAPIVYSPGPYAEARMHPAATISPDLSALVVGSTASSPDTGLFSIPDVLAGTDAIASDFHFPRVLEGPLATLVSVRDALPAANVFHFAGHTASTSSRTGLMLQGDTPSGGAVLLDADMVRVMNLKNMQLAVLAACNTDAGEGGTRGLTSIAQAFQISGVPHVVASRWSVDSVEANEFMDYFYRSLLSGKSVSSATRLTLQKMLSVPRTSHPYFWSAFASYGRP